MEYDVRGGQHLPQLLSAFVSHNPSIIASERVRSVGLHVPTKSKSSFLLSRSSEAVALPSNSRFAIQLALACATLYHACHDALPIDGNCYSPSVYIHHILSSVSSHCLSHAPLYSSAHCCPCHIGTVGKLSSTSTSLFLLDCPHATVAVRSPSARHQTALCSLTLAFAR